MLHSVTNGETPEKADEMLALVKLNGNPFWRDARSGRTFPQVAGSDDMPPGEGDGADGGDADDHADDEEAADAERARRRIQSLRTGEKRLKDLLKTQGQELDTLRSKQREREDADKSESEKLKEQIADLERKSTTALQKLVDTQNRSAIERAATRAGATDPEDVFRLLDAADFEHDEEGNLTNAETLVKELLRKKAYLVKAEPAAATRGVPSTPRANGTPQQAREEEVKNLSDEYRSSGKYPRF